MRNRGTQASAVGARWCRALAVIAVCVFSLQSMRLPLITAKAAATCCCPHHAEDADCKCPVCTHLRELRSGKPYFKSCGSHSTATIALISFAPALPVVNAPARSVPPQIAVSPRPWSPAPGPALDVPTPPPLAQA